MAYRGESCSQKRKSSDKMKVKLVHNAEATNRAQKKQTATTYVNICNYSTPDIVWMCGKTTYIL